MSDPSEQDEIIKLDLARSLAMKLWTYFSLLQFKQCEFGLAYPTIEHQSSYLSIAKR